jgi:hypothetical protein
MGIGRIFGAGLILGVFAGLSAAPFADEAQARPRPHHARRARAARASKASHKKRGCRREKPVSFLVRKNFMKNGQLRPKIHQKALRFRAEHYGWVEGLGLEAYADHSAISDAVQTKFMGLPVRVHKKIVPKLHCVERTIRASCNGKGQRYVPHAIGGFREQNTYRQGEVSNHLFGIAIDIDPEKNPCCGCVDPWPTHPNCQDQSKSVYQKTALPRCWIDAFEQHGFYWLGHDTLQDTMHFEYLGNPDR